MELSLVTSSEDSSYINANFIKVDEEEMKTLHVFLEHPKQGVERGLGRGCCLQSPHVIFVPPSGCLWTQGLYCHPGSFTYNCPGLLENDLGIPCLGEYRVASGTWEGAGGRM